MDLLTLNQFAVLLWKNFTLKRRQFINLIMEVFTALMFPMMLLLFRIHIHLKILGPYNFTSQPISTLPSFLKNPEEWELIYLPSNIDVVKEITENVKRNLNISIKVRGFSSETEFEKYIKYDYESRQVLAAIVFDHDFKNSNDPLPLQVKYHLRFVRIQRTIWWPDKVGWKTSLLFPVRPSVGPRNPDYDDGGSPGYIREGFLAVQHALDKAIMLYHESSARKKLFDGISVFVQRFPHPAYAHDRLIVVTSSFFPLMFIFMFSPTVLSIVRSIVWEREKGLKEYQLIIGLRNWMIWAAYFFIFFLFYIIIISLICVLFFIFNEPIFRYSDYSFIFVFLMCYAIASIFFGFMVSTFFSKARVAASAGSLLYFASFFPFNAIAHYYGQITLAKKVAACLSSNVVLALGINHLLKLEIREIGVKWDNLWTPATLEDNFVFGYMLGMLLLDAFLYGLVTWYVETVFPGQYGVPQPWYFFLMRSYWFGQPQMRREKEEMKGCSGTENKYFEAEPTNLVAGIQIKHLHKEFGDKVAVNNMSLNLYKGQITILLGQNGAGKTTTLSILTGMYSALSRIEAYINGYDISKNIVEIQKNLSFCPQHDLLFNNLTLSEHLFFYSVVKRRYQKMCPVEIDQILSTLNLLEKRDTFSKSLSEGMKRKLSIIIALLGDSQVVILDEPSSSVDPISRRAIWDLLQQKKHNRTILMTTHYMDEADILGDRIAIMVKGTLQCCGSSVFLKQIYGAGYHIVLEREPHCDVEKISAMIQSHIPDATLENCIGTELSFILPKEYTHRFEALFNDLEKKQKELGIASLGASITTMEEVFLKVHKLTDSQMDIQPVQSPCLKSQNIRQDMNWNMNMPRNYERPVFSRLNEVATIKFNTGFPLYCQQFRSMFIKRALFTWRNWKLILLQTSVILIVTTYLLLTVKLHYELPAREMDLSQYGRTIVPYSISGNSDLSLNLIKNLKIFLNAKNQELREVQGNIINYILENKECRDFSIIALSIDVEKNKTIFTILFNNEAYHSAATSLAVLDNILFMSLSGPNASIKVSNKPQPLPLYGSNIVPTNGLQIVLCLAFGMAVVVSSFCLQTVTERTTNAKHIQFVSGVYVLAYWLSALLWDLIYFSISCCLLLVIFKYCGMDAFVADYHFLDTMMIFMLYGWSVVPLMYLGSFLFSSSTAAYVRLTLFNYFSTVFSIIMYILIQQYGPDYPYYTKTLVSNVLMVLPSYNFAMSISRFFDDYEVKKMCARQFPSMYVDCSEKVTENNVYGFGERGIAKFFISLAALGLFYLLLLFCLETTFWSLKNSVFHKTMSNVYNILRKVKKAIVPTRVIKEYENEDVEKERKRILALLPKLKNSPLLLKELTKIYFKCPVVKAVRNISLVVKESECFGLLGLNGAGKTTTFRMLTGEETITSGVVFIDGISITENIRKVRSRIGYCPQSNPVLNHMTGRELLIMYARLRGVPEPEIYKYVETFLHSMHLETHADKSVHIYSRGNKRKLNTAIALMGKSSVVFLDEPSTGMDPVARRWLWDTVTWMCKTGKAIIITSHSMEECEALCTRLAIMVKGRFKCLGSPQQLKNKFGNTYSLTAKIKIDENEDKLKEFKEFIETTFPGNIDRADCDNYVKSYMLFCCMSSIINFSHELLMFVELLY
ncbi:PREDICTED: ATP-binding cassette sub-family A member 3-like [Ceratotherium simum simum]|uniref:ATP-binding cassette sub-family A member 3-like n=1 Tax=Ceratotherium simum simum TaxID=73337 RepID=A0ABM1DLJ9_CERSS|nr:PREDICTED: ATP-binding cassette sub-family A member 3-like [Ceratotherium simum simum]